MRVGTSFIGSRRRSAYKDHPHACGDKFTNNTWIANTIGSSPCVWGQAQGAAVFFRDDGIIPMRVGTRTATFTQIAGKEDHPHACGDKTKEIKENSGFAKSTA